MSQYHGERERLSLSTCEIEASTLTVLPGQSGSDGKKWWNEVKGVSESGDVVEVECQSLTAGMSIRIAPMERKCGGWDEEHFHESLRVPDGASDGIVVTLEARARECVVVALSPSPRFILGKTYAVHFGANGNLSTVFRRRLPNGTEAVDATFSRRGTCDDQRFQSYWVVLQQGHLYAGLGRQPGRECLGMLDDVLYNQLRSGVDAVRFVGVGNSALGRSARDLRVRRLRACAIPSCFGSAGIPMEPPSSSIFPSDGNVNDNKEPADGEIDEQLLREYDAECAKARKRAKKFGLDYKPPDPGAFFKWSEARRLRSNPERGFVTGLDLNSPEELDKARRRRDRFNQGADNNDGEDGATPQDQNEERHNEDAKTPLPVEQAWDNFDLVSEFRFDPIHNDQTEPANQTDLKLEGDQNEDHPQPPDHKLHIFSIDWAAFKQIRSDDVEHYFADYGPSYVEWLGELSCNVHFGDNFSAQRALAALSMELPTPPPPSVLDAYTSSTISEPADATQTQHTTSSEPTTSQSIADLGAMGWRFGHRPLYKVANDAFGRRGTHARILMRHATLDDVLERRPTHRPKPPPGFSTRRILGPGAEYDQNFQQNKKRRRLSAEQQQQQQQQRRRWSAGGRGSGKRRKRDSRSAVDGTWLRDMGDNNQQDDNDDYDGEFEEEDSYAEENVMDEDPNEEHPGLNRGLETPRQKTLAKNE